MKPSELFGVLIRTTGFLVILYSLWNVWAGMDNVVESFLPANQGSDASDLPSTFSYFAFGVPAFILGAILFFFADFIVKLAYRDPS
jgi:hypothetical protein